MSGFRETAVNRWAHAELDAHLAARGIQVPEERQLHDLGPADAGAYLQQQAAIASGPAWADGLRGFAVVRDKHSWSREREDLTKDATRGPAQALDLHVWERFLRWEQESGVPGVLCIIEGHRHKGPAALWEPLLWYASFARLRAGPSCRQRAWNRHGKQKVWWPLGLFSIDATYTQAHPHPDAIDNARRKVRAGEDRPPEVQEILDYEERA